MARESTIEKDIVKVARSMGYEVFKFTSPGRRGVPDRAFVNQYGVTCFIEVKRPGGFMTPLQEREIKRLNSRRLKIATCVDNVEDAIKFLKFNRELLVAE